MSTVTEILTDEAQRARITVEQLRGRRIWQHYVAARRAVAHRLRAIGYSYPAIGQAIGGRHHTSVMAYFWTAEDRRDKTVEMAIATKVRTEGRVAH